MFQGIGEFFESIERTCGNAEAAFELLEEYPSGVTRTMINAHCQMQKRQIEENEKEESAVTFMTVKDLRNFQCSDPEAELPRGISKLILHSTNQEGIITAYIEHWFPAHAWIFHLNRVIRISKTKSSIPLKGMSLSSEKHTLLNQCIIPVWSQNNPLDKDYIECEEVLKARVLSIGRIKKHHSEGKCRAINLKILNFNQTRTLTLNLLGEELVFIGNLLFKDEIISLNLDRIVEHGEKQIVIYQRRSPHFFVGAIENPSSFGILDETDSCISTKMEPDYNYKLSNSISRNKMTFRGVVITSSNSCSSHLGEKRSWKLHLDLSSCCKNTTSMNQVTLRILDWLESFSPSSLIGEFVQVSGIFENSKVDNQLEATSDLHIHLLSKISALNCSALDIPRVSINDIQRLTTTYVEGQHEQSNCWLTNGQITRIVKEESEQQVSVDPIYLMTINGGLSSLSSIRIKHSALISLIKDSGACEIDWIDGLLWKLYDLVVTYSKFTGFYCCQLRKTHYAQSLYIEANSLMKFTSNEHITA